MTALRALLLAVSLLLGIATSPPAAAASADTDPVGVWPLQPTHEVVHDFDPPADPWGSGHRGVDLAGTVGQSVHAALTGKVAFVGKIAGKPAVTISHGDTRTTYEPVSSTLEVGATVAAGDRIGALELPFSHCFPAACLHWGLLRGDNYLDPLSLVGSGRVRLLPLWRDQPVDHSATAWTPATSPYADLPANALPYAAWLPLLRAFPAVNPPLRPGVRLAVGLAEPVGGDVRVELRRGQ